MMVAPAALAAATTSLVFASMLVLSITSATAPCSAPPSEVNSFWYSISTTAVVAGFRDIVRPPRQHARAARIRTVNPTLAPQRGTGPTSSGPRYLVVRQRHVPGFGHRDGTRTS